MMKSLVLRSFHALRWALIAVGGLALLLTALVATPLTRPPELRSISGSRGMVDMSTLPLIERFQARDGTQLGFRHYRPIGALNVRVAIVVHGSSGSGGNNIHA